VTRRLAGPGVAILPVVKADAYGHGMLPIARILAGAGADGLSVATLDEAMELRDRGITAPIIVMYPIPPDGATVAASRSIAVAAGEPAAVDAILEAATSAGLAGEQRGTRARVEGGPAELPQRALRHSCLRRS